MIPDPVPTSDRKNLFTKGNKEWMKRDENYQTRTATLMMLAKDVVSDDDFRDVLKKMLELAKTGDEKAAMFIQNARFGKLRETIAVEHSTPLFDKVESAMEEIEKEDQLGLPFGEADDATDREAELRTGLPIPESPAGD